MMHGKKYIKKYAYVLGIEDIYFTHICQLP